jgi:hypothetical protein
VAAISAARSLFSGRETAGKMQTVVVLSQTQRNGQAAS